MPTTVATPTDVDKANARIDVLQDRVALLEGQFEKLMTEFTTLHGGTATEEAGD
jgi:outer membrane protein TolC